MTKKRAQDRTTYAISTKESRKAGKRSFGKAKKGKSKSKKGSRGK
jgi:hypothetical protein